MKCIGPLVGTCMPATKVGNSEALAYIAASSASTLRAETRFSGVRPLPLFNVAAPCPGRPVAKRWSIAPASASCCWEPTVRSIARVSAMKLLE